jgi:pSer/pThr/pTyr-binding forkhead associated (FHA) protein
MDVLLFLIRLLLSALLYVFLGAVLLLLWRDVKSATRHQVALNVRERPAQLRVLRGRDTLNEGAVLKLQPLTTLGRAESNSIALGDPYASSEHALVAWRNGQWWLEDRDSRNGTLLNDFLVEEPLVISHGDIIGIGQMRFKFEMCDALEAAAPETVLST